MPKRLPLLLAGSLVWTLACAGLGGEKDDAPEDEPGLFEDKDKDDDGYAWDEDCNDDNAAIHPGAQEVCDPADVDEDCDGLADGADDDTSGTITAYHDADGDGFGDPADPVAVCEAGAGYVLDATDCDDANPAISPAAVEVCDNLVDNDCDGLLDNADDSVDDTTRIDVWEDADGDGFGEEATATRACFVATGYADRADDCDDDDPLTNPAADELCGGGDEDCDGTVDEDDAVDAPTWHDDADGDGYGDPDDATVACDAPTRHVSDGTDCDDATRANHPGADEVCDEADNDCDGETDEDDALDASPWYADADRDGYGDAASPRAACDPPSGYVADATDCDDDSAAVRPGATEVCDSADTDEDCDGLADDADSSTSSSGKRTYYADADGDGYGRSTGTLRCDLAAGYATTNTDCDDTDASISPDGAEVCDPANADEDCDGRADDADTSVSAATMSTWYPDADGDGHGTPGSPISRCDAPSLYAATTDDCDDSRASVSPSRAEVCDPYGFDEDCDGYADDADPDMPTTSKTGWALDADGDGWGPEAATVYRCEAPAGYALTGDCDDGADHVHPDAVDACADGADADCDGAITCTGITADVAFTNTSSSYNYALLVTSLGDVDGDGIDDVASAASRYGSTVGEASILDVGAGSGAITSRRLARVEGDAAFDYLGRTLGRLPDVDGDGADELLLSSSTAEGAATEAGLVYVIPSTTAVGASGTATSLARAVIQGSYYSSSLGYETLVGLDWDGDGDGEALVFGDGVYSYYGTPQRAYVLDVEEAGTFAEEDDALFTVADPTGATLHNYACAGDVDGDGLDDLFLNAYVSSAFWFRLYLSTGAGGTITPDDDDGRFSGGITCAVGDFDGDGVGDLVSGDWSEHLSSTVRYSGRVRVYTGLLAGGSSAATATISGTTGSAHAGEDIAVLRDQGGDGRDEIALGYLDGTASPGAVAIFDGGVTGSLTTADAPFVLLGRYADDDFGVALAAADLDGDDVDDLVVGAPYDDGGATSAGAILVYYGSGFFER